jgi:hypothetical protein
MPSQGEVGAVVLLFQVGEAYFGPCIHAKVTVTPRYTCTDWAPVVWVHVTTGVTVVLSTLVVHIVRGHLSVSLPSLSSPPLSTLLYSPLLSHTHPCSYVHAPTLCTITRCQTLKADDSQTSRMSTCKLVDYYCHWHSTFPLRSYLWSFGQALDALEQVHVILQHPLLSHGHLLMGGLVLGGLVLQFPVYHL